MFCIMLTKEAIKNEKMCTFGVFQLLRKKKTKKIFHSIVAKVKVEAINENNG